MRFLFLLFLPLLFITPIQAQNGWMQVYSKPGLTLKKAFFINQSTGWICGDSGRIVKTTNGGFTWSLYESGSSHAFNDIFFIDENKGWAVGGTKNSSGFSYTVVAFTNDGGNFWNVSTGMNYNNANKFVYFSNALNGFILAGGSSGGSLTGAVTKTTNAGVSWNTSETITSYNLLKKGNSETIWLGYQKWADAGYSNGDSVFIQTSTNEGNTWQTKSKFNGYQIFEVSMQNENSIDFIVRPYVSGGNKLLLRSTNGGVNWFADSLNFGFTVSGVSFINNNTGWISANGNLYKTTNNGVNWINQLSGFTGTVFMKDSVNGICYGSNGKIFITGTGGVTNIISGNGMPNAFSLSQNYPNPFNPSTIISYQLAINSFVQFKIYNALGNEVQTLVNKKQNAGSYSVDFNATSLPSGIYFYKLVTEKFSETKKMILIK
ncbi:MAG: T9SS type A sorting domain-containing protein [Bacteroidetes bacterium]|nr:T9SS type A sorting domain-containing protein [Bacteroidota bacterium]